MYGITETTVHVTYQPLSREMARAARGSPIGVKLPDLRLYVLDGRMAPAPVGVPGEIYVGGAGLARGYLNRPELTAERFVPDPFEGESGARLYRTGDLGRWRPDGTVEYLGRVDQQVKIRGFRIEPGEIEAALREHEHVQDAVVLLRDDGGEEKRLVAYVVPCEANPLESAQLRAHLRLRLPDYMVPALYVSLSQLPRTPNGKLDRKALPAPEPVRAESYAPPQTLEQETVAAIWAETLGVERVGVQDNFFDLGGHSLAIAGAHRKIQDKLGIEFPLIAMFEHPTIESLTSFLDGSAGGQSFDRIRERGEKQLQRRREVRERRKAAAAAGASETEEQSPWQPPTQ